MSTPLPAHKTKHLETLHYPIPNTLHILTLTQTQSPSSSASTGTTLWLSSQLLTYHLLTLFLPLPHRRRPHGRAIDLGAGTGLTSHILSYLGFRVCATDLVQITGAILSKNVARNEDLLASIAGTSPISIRALDWTVPLPSPPSSLWEGGNDGEEVEVIVTADTIYKQDLIRPLILTIRALCVASARCARGGSGKEVKKFPLVLVAVEVRDRGLLQCALEVAAQEGFECRRVGDGRVRRGLEAAGVHWAREEWEGGEVWRWVFK
ncbi:hypothetical protein HOY80DRAFT_906397, partial [Tuber brumale]